MGAVRSRFTRASSSKRTRVQLSAVEGMRLQRDKQRQQPKRRIVKRKVQVMVLVMMAQNRVGLKTMRLEEGDETNESSSSSSKLAASPLRRVGCVEGKEDEEEKEDNWLLVANKSEMIEKEKRSSKREEEKEAR